jgi:natural resistance-associated macrophage protein
LSSDDLNNCQNLDLNRAPFLLKNVLGKWSSTAFAIALLASGQSSSITGTYAGQFIMQGFLNLKMKAWLRNLMTRLIAIFPSLIVSVIYGSSGAGKLIIVASMILSFQLPFTLIPLMKFTNSEKKMGTLKNSIGIAVVAWVITCLVILINLYFILKAFVTWLIHSRLPKASLVFIALSVFPLMAIYIVAIYIVGILYFSFRTDKKFTYLAPGESSLPSTVDTPNPQRELENRGT